VVVGDWRLVSLRLTKKGKCSRAEVDIVHIYIYFTLLSARFQIHMYTYTLHSDPTCDDLADVW